jgi:hypothetical protein
VPSVARVLPIEVSNLLGRKTCQLLLDVLLVASSVVPLHPQVSRDADEEDETSCGTVEAVTDGVVGLVLLEVGPSSDETTNVAKHDVETNCTASSGITDNVGADVSVCHGTQDHASAGNQETSTVSNTSSL